LGGLSNSTPPDLLLPALVKSATIRYEQRDIVNIPGFGY
jgi:hypothetical protein